MRNPMTIEFRLQEVSEGVESVDIAEIMVAPGDVIAAGTIICEVETDKAVAEIECPHAGTVKALAVSEGDTVSIGDVLLLIEESVVAGAAADSTTPPANNQPKPESPVEAPSPVAAAPAIESAGGAPQTIDFNLQEVSEGVDAVDIAEVMVSVGDTITAGTVICEVETDKAVAEIECPHAGTITAIHVSSGDNVKIGGRLISIKTTSLAGAGTSAPAKPASDAASPKPKAAAPPTTASNVPSAKTSTTATTPPSSVRPSLSGGGQPPPPAGPATRRLARKLGVDLHGVTGTARGGRITIEDVEGFVRDRMSGAAAASGGNGSMGIVQAAPLPDFSQFGTIERQPLNKIYRTAAANLHAAWVTIPHVTQHNLADITELETARKRYVSTNPKSPKITMTAIMIKAVVGALRAFPQFNSSLDLDSGELIVKKYFHIGVAVDTPNGLVVPVIRNCDQKNVLQVAAELSELAEKARDRKLKTSDMQGASFTITNLGGIGGTYFTPIVNHPEVAILGMSRGQKTLQMGNDEIVERLMLPLSLSYDHRAINGADAARFIVKLSGSLTNLFELF